MSESESCESYGGKFLYSYACCFPTHPSTHTDWFLSSSMIAEVVLLLVLISVSLGKANNRLFDLKCEPADGVVGKTTKIPCNVILSSEDQGIDIYVVSIFRSGQDDPVFKFQGNNKTGDLRFNLPSVNNLSLELSNTALTDDGEYNYQVLTNRGVVEDGSFWISVTSKYNEPITSSWPEKIKDGGHVDLYCNASGGFPAGAIHWFDITNTNWTKSASIYITEGEDNLLQLSSKLTFTNIDSSWAPFRCVVLNNKFIQEGESTFHLKMIGGDPGSSVTVAVVFVIAGIIGILVLLVLLFRRKHIQQGRRPSAQPILRASAVHYTQEEDEDQDQENAEAEVLNTEEEDEDQDEENAEAEAEEE